MVNNIADNFFVITGGPGSGKSLLIEALRKRGYACFVEVRRGVVAGGGVGEGGRHGLKRYRRSHAHQAAERNRSVSEPRA